jgi:S-adenosylmethionine hydrolase
VGGLVDAYAEGPAGDAAVIAGSTGRLEVFVKSGSARQLLGAGRGAGVRVRRSG